MRGWEALKNGCRQKIPRRDQEDQLKFEMKLHEQKTQLQTNLTTQESQGSGWPSLDWLRFWGQFTGMILKSVKAPISKFTYLRGLLGPKTNVCWGQQKAEDLYPSTQVRVVPNSCGPLWCKCRSALHQTRWAGLWYWPFWVIQPYKRNTPVISKKFLFVTDYHQFHPLSIRNEVVYHRPIWQVAEFIG